MHVVDEKPCVLFLFVPPKFLLFSSSFNDIIHMSNTASARSSISLDIEMVMESQGHRMRMDDGWIDMEPVWDLLHQIGHERDIQKLSYRSTKNWSSESTHFLGIVGETALSFVTGIPVNAFLDPQGDGNKDFSWDGRTIDVKTTKYWSDPYLKQYPQPKSWCDVYVLAATDIPRKRAKIFGWVEREAMQMAPIMDYGYGPQLSLRHTELNQSIPTFLPVRSLRRA